MSVKLTFIPNILEDEKIEGFFSPGILGDILKEFFLLNKVAYPKLAKTKIRIEEKSLDGEDWELIPPTEWVDHKVEDESELRIIPSYGQIGGGGPWTTIVGAIIFAIGVYAGFNPYLMSIGASMMIGGVIALAAGFPAFGSGPDLAETSSTYSWEDQPNQTDPSLPVPIIYGTHRITPHLINAYIDQFIEFIWNLQYFHLLLIHRSLTYYLILLNINS